MRKVELSNEGMKSAVWEMIVDIYIYIYIQNGVVKMMCGEVLW